MDDYSGVSLIDKHVNEQVLVIDLAGASELNEVVPEKKPKSGGISSDFRVEHLHLKCVQFIEPGMILDPELTYFGNACPLGHSTG